MSLMTESFKSHTKVDIKIAAVAPLLDVKH